ncbi:DinB family protein [Flaviaesturariibacter amylovorans]|uniref:DinB-like domain-containing protein n=1 Tax=Flaviaesturariibacter amylovorans TaxID=1084520 RepID=A0ABP8G3U6_9BACT
MRVQTVIEDIRNSLVSSFSSIDAWFDKEAGVRSYKPQNGGWSINEVLEHIALTNHFLLILIDKGARKALDNASRVNVEDAVKDYEFHRDRLDEVGIHKSFDWIRPEHMEPKGGKSLTEVRQELNGQLERCLGHLQNLGKGEGVLYRTTMSVNGLGKIDVYEYIYFLAQHGQRHITQMHKVEAEYQAGASSTSA